MEVKEFLSDSMHAVFIENDIIETSVPDTWNLRYSTSVASRDMTQLLRLAKHNEHVCLMVNVATVNFSSEARKLIMRRLKEIPAVALIVRSNTHRMIANFFILMHKRTVPIRSFSDKNDAKEWLREHVALSKKEQMAS